MKTSGKLLKNTLEYLTQCFLLPGVKLDIEQVFMFYSKNFESMLWRRKRF